MISKYEKMRQRAVNARGDYHQHLYDLSHVGDEKTRSSSHDNQWKKNRAAWGAEAGEYVSNIRPAEAMSLTDYTSQCGSYNERMRNPNPENRRKMENQTDTLESALGKYKTKTDMKVYRVVDKKGIAAMMAGAGIPVEPEMVEPNMLEGALLHDKGFMSTSVFPDLQWPGEFRLVIDIPAGSEVGAPLMDAHNTYSRDMDSNGDRGEFLMKPGLFLQVTGVEAVGGGNDMDRFSGFSYVSSLTAKKSIVHCKVCSIPGGGLLR